MDRAPSDDPSDFALVRMDDHALAVEHGSVHAPDRQKTEKAVAIDVIHDQGDLVDMAREHDAELPLRISHRVLVAVHILVDLIDVRPDIGLADALDARLIAARAGCREKFLEKG